MKFFHLSDLHLGKRVNEYSMLEDQAYILDEILDIIREEKPDGVMIAGDVYDKAVPPAEAVALFDDFLVKLSEIGTSVFVISGNHDSPERIAFGGRLMTGSNIHMSPVYNGSLTPVVMEDAYGKVNVWMLPFIKPVHVRRFHDEEESEIVSYTDAVRTVIEDLDIPAEERNIMITHQFVTGAERTESEEISVGGSDNVDASVFEPFDYIALGHIHRPQNCGMESVRYSGTPLKYSFSEVKDKKSITVVELQEKGNLNIRTIPLIPKHDMAEIKGNYQELTSRAFYQNTSYPEDYLHITLTDEEDIPDAVGKLGTIYHRIMKLDYDNVRTRSTAHIDAACDTSKKSPYDLFSEFYEKQNNQPMNELQSEYIKTLIENVWEDER